MNDLNYQVSSSLQISPIKHKDYSDSSSEDEYLLTELVNTLFQENKHQTNVSSTRWSGQQSKKLITIRHENPDLSWAEIGVLVSKGDTLRTGGACSGHYHRYLRTQTKKVDTVSQIHFEKRKEREIIEILSEPSDSEDEIQPIKKKKSDSTDESTIQDYNQGLELYDHKDYEQALEFLLPLKRHSEASYFAGMCYYNLGFLTKAIPLLAHSIKTPWNEQIPQGSIEEYRKFAKHAIQVCNWVRKIKIQKETKVGVESELENDLFAIGCKALNNKDYNQALIYFRECKKSGEKFFHIALCYLNNKQVADHYLKFSFITPWSKSIPITCIRDTISDYLPLINRHLN